MKKTTTNKAVKNSNKAVKNSAQSAEKERENETMKNNENKAQSTQNSAQSVHERVQSAEQMKESAEQFKNDLRAHDITEEQRATLSCFKEQSAEQRAQYEKQKAVHSAMHRAQKNRAVQNAMHSACAVIAEQSKAEQKAKRKAKRAQSINRVQKKAQRDDILSFIAEQSTKHSAVIAGASTEDMKHRAVQRDKHMIIKLVLSDSSVRICVKADARLEQYENLKVVNYNLPYQFLIHELNENTRTQIENIFTIAFENYENSLKEKAEKKAQKEKKAEKNS